MSEARASRRRRHRGWPPPIRPSAAMLLVYLGRSTVVSCLFTLTKLLFRSLARSLVSFFSTTSCPRLLVVSIFFLFLPHFFLYSFFFFFFLSFLLRPPLSDPRTLFLLFVLALYFSQSRFFVTPLSARPPSSSSGVAAHSHRTCVTGDVIQLVS